MKLSSLLLSLLLLFGCSHIPRSIVFADSLNDKEKSQVEEDPLFQASLDDLGEIIVPKTLDEVFTELDRGLSDYAKKLLIKNPDELTKEERQIMAFSLGHFGLGIWMRNNWGLWGGSDLAIYFNSIGIHHPDDMSGVILDSYSAKLREEEFDLDEQVKFYQNYWARATPPDSIVDESTGHTIGLVESETSYHLESGIIIHVGEDKETLETWFFSHERGWFKPTSEEIEIIKGEIERMSERIN